jgi:hypothetical protein
MLSEAQAAFVQGDVMICLATRDDALRPEVTRAFGAAVDPDRTTLTIYVPTAYSARTLANLRAHPELAVVFCRPLDYQTLQLKGRCVGVRPTSSADRALVQRYRELAFTALAEIGLPRCISDRWVTQPAVAVELRVHEAYKQTPGPGAGERA